MSMAVTNFARLHLLHWAKQPALSVHLWAFDLLAFNGPGSSVAASG